MGMLAIIPDAELSFGSCSCSIVLKTWKKSKAKADCAKEPVQLEQN